MYFFVSFCEVMKSNIFYRFCEDMISNISRLRLILWLSNTRWWLVFKRDIHTCNAMIFMMVCRCKMIIELKIIQFRFWKWASFIVSYLIENIIIAISKMSFLHANMKCVSPWSIICNSKHLSIFLVKIFKSIANAFIHKYLNSSVTNANPFYDVSFKSQNPYIFI